MGARHRYGFSHWTRSPYHIVRVLGASITAQSSSSKSSSLGRHPPRTRTRFQIATPPWRRRCLMVASCWEKPTPVMLGAREGRLNLACWGFSGGPLDSSLAASAFEEQMWTVATPQWIWKLQRQMRLSASAQRCPLAWVRKSLMASGRNGMEQLRTSARRALRVCSVTRHSMRQTSCAAPWAASRGCSGGRRSVAWRPHPFFR
mmetsp:Transcript_81691/g.212445  ORF Transcript_81691/g.212445 Transcript_81691/m.212445 type:complete len:203 (-) Transcript_81691:3-611(-)